MEKASSLSGEDRCCISVYEVLAPRDRGCFRDVASYQNKLLTEKKVLSLNKLYYKLSKPTVANDVSAVVLLSRC